MNNGTNLNYEQLGPDAVSPAHKLLLFSGHSNPALAESVAKYLDIRMGRALVSRFSNGEVRVRIEENVRGAKVYVIQPTCGRVNDSLMEMLILIDALSRSSAYSICAVIPYYGYAKQEKKMGREPISAKLVANLIHTAGADHVITVDLHAAAIQGFFDIPVDNLSALPELAEKFREMGLANEELVVVSPDAGGVARATKLAEKLGAKLAIIFKRRPEADQTEVIEIVGDIAGKTCLIVDDMISTGNTLVHGVEALMQKGARRVYAAATHAIFAGNAVDIIENSSIRGLIVTDSIPLSESAKKMKKLTVIPLANLLGKAILNTHLNHSMSDLYL